MDKSVTLGEIAEINLWRETDVLPFIGMANEPGEWWQIRDNGDGTWTLRSGVERLRR